MDYITDEMVVKRAQAAVELELKKRFAMDLPISVYDRETGNIYYEYNDGRRELVAKGSKRGRYSEWSRQEA